MYSSSTASFSSLWHSSKNLWDSSHRAQKVSQNLNEDVLVKNLRCFLYFFIGGNYSTKCFG